MIAALDVGYPPEGGALSAMVLFSDWSDETATEEQTLPIAEVAEYEPGQFYKRELPCLISILEPVLDQLDCIVIDGYVWLGSDRKGLGVYLYESLEKKIPVIGVAKTSFHEAPGEEVLRGISQNPLFVTAIGIETKQAAQFIQSMHGPHRHPTLLKRADSMTRGR